MIESNTPNVTTTSHNGLTGLSWFRRQLITADALATRWGCDRRTIRALQDGGDLHPVEVLGKRNIVHYRIAEIEALESSMANPPTTPLTPESVDAMERLQKSLSEIKTLLLTSKSSTPDPTVDARRRQAATDRMNELVPGDDRFKPVFDAALKNRLDRDASFDVDQVEAFVAEERATHAKLVAMLAKERHDRTMAAIAGPTRTERADEVTRSMRPYKGGLFGKATSAKGEVK